MTHISCSSHAFPRHFHDGLYAIGLMHRGASYCLGPDRAEFTVRQGQACLFNPGQVHSCVPVARSDVSYTMLSLRENTLRTLAEDVSQGRRSAPEFTTLICDNPQLISALHALIQTRSDACSLAQDSALVHVLGDLMRMHAGISASPEVGDLPLVHRAKEILRANLDQKITLQEMSQQLGASRYHLLRTFKRQSGIPPHVFRVQCRITEARRMIRMGVPLVEVAQLTGFTDQPHLNNTFKLYTGITPGKYAQITKPSSSFQHKEFHET